MAKAKKLSFEGKFEPLGKPLPALVLGEMNPRTGELIREKMHLLLEYKKIALMLEYCKMPADTNPWFALAMILALEREPGFQFGHRTRNKRRPLVWSGGRLVQLWLAVEDHTKGKNRANKQVCHHLAKKEPWKTWLAEGRGALSEKTAKPEDTLYKRYQNACEHIKQLRDIFQQLSFNNWHGFLSLFKGS